MAPRPAPLRDTVLGEDVLVDVVEDSVANEPRVRPGYGLAAPVGVAGRRDPGVGRVRLTLRRMGDVVAEAVEALDVEADRRGGSCRVAGDRSCGRSQRGEDREGNA